MPPGLNNESEGLGLMFLASWQHLIDHSWKQGAEIDGLWSNLIRYFSQLLSCCSLLKTSMGPSGLNAEVDISKGLPFNSTP